MRHQFKVKAWKIYIIDFHWASNEANPNGQIALCFLVKKYLLSNYKEDRHHSFVTFFKNILNNLKHFLKYIKLSLIVKNK